MSTPKTSGWRLHAGALGALALITGLGYVVGVRPLLIARVEAWELDHSLNEKRSVLDELRAELATTKSDLAAVRSTLNAGDINLVGSSLLNSQLAKLGIIAESAGVAVSEAAPGAPEEGPLLVRIPIRISGKSHYPDFAAFLRALDKDLKDTVVVGFNLGGRADTPSEPATFSVDLLWYALREGAASEVREGTSPARARSGG